MSDLKNHLVTKWKRVQDYGDKSLSNVVINVYGVRRGAAETRAYCDTLKNNENLNANIFIYYLFLFRSARSTGLRQCLAIRGSCFSFLDPLDIW
jgi:hypothetical protein